MLPLFSRLLSRTPGPTGGTSAARTDAAQLLTGALRVQSIELGRAADELTAAADALKAAGKIRPAVRAKTAAAAARQAATGWAE